LVGPADRVGVNIWAKKKPGLAMGFFEVHKPRFAAVLPGNAPVKRIATGFDWVERPIWFGDTGCLLFSDIPNDRVRR